MKEHNWIKIGPYDSEGDGADIFWCSNCGMLRIGGWDYTESWYYVRGSASPISGEPRPTGSEIQGPTHAPPCKG
jgi:hypothetical protein